MPIRGLEWTLHQKVLALAMLLAMASFLGSNVGGRMWSADRGSPGSIVSVKAGPLRLRNPNSRGTHRLLGPEAKAVVQGRLAMGGRRQSGPSISAEDSQDGNSNAVGERLMSRNQTHTWGVIELAGQANVLTGTHKTGGPLWPAGMPSSYPWKQAKEKGIVPTLKLEEAFVLTADEPQDGIIPKDQFYRMIDLLAGAILELPERRPGLKEYLYARKTPRPQACGSPCIAHCIAGQPREMTTTPGLYKSIKHRLIDKLSEDPVVFGFFPISGMGGGIGAGAGGSCAVEPYKLVPAIEYLKMDRGLFIHESCADLNCLEEYAGMTCNAKELELTKYNQTTGKWSAFCDVQLRRFQSCMHLVREYEQDQRVEFKWVTRIRPDVYITEVAGPVSKLSAEHVYMKKYTGCGYGGADWLYAAPRFAADIIARFADEMTCDMLKHKYILPVPCRDCMGCECMLMAWMLNQGVEWSHFPWDGVFPLKFCIGSPECALDWEPNLETICKGTGDQKMDFCLMRKSITQNYVLAPKGT